MISLTIATPAIPVALKVSRLSALIPPIATTGTETAAVIAFRVVKHVNERIAAGHDVINLGQGNPDQPTPENIVHATQQAVETPSILSEPSNCRVTATGSSSSPICTPAASTAKQTSTRSSMINGIR